MRYMSTTINIGFNLNIRTLSRTKFLVCLIALLCFPSLASIRSDHLLTMIGVYPDPPVKEMPPVCR